MKSQTFKLGTFKFDELQFEVPEDLEIKTRLLGGAVEIPQAPGSAAQVVTQTFGTVVEPITIKATFLGLNALDNVRKLEGIMLAQQTVSFSFGSMSWDVTVFGVGKKIHSFTEIEYTLDLTPQRDTSSSAVSSTTTTGPLATAYYLKFLALYPSPPL